MHSIPHPPASCTQPKHKPAIEENESQAQDLIICRNAWWVFSIYQTVTIGTLMQAKIEISGKKHWAATQGSYSTSILEGWFPWYFKQQSMGKHYHLSNIKMAE